MEKSSDKFDKQYAKRNMPVQSEDLAFSPEEMVKCDGCSRFNPPNRLKCFYCARDLNIAAVKAEIIKPNLRKLEDWENGFNVIYLANRQRNEIDIAKIAKLLSIEVETLNAIFDPVESMPLARVESEQEARVVSDRLRTFGLECKIVGDEALMDETPPKRLRGLNFVDQEIHLIDFNTGETKTIYRGDLALIVTGAIYRSKNEVVRKIKRGEKKVLDQSQTTSDEVLIDLYSKDDSLGFRIPTSGFDFSCLGGEKEMLAINNIRKLTRKLAEFAPNTKLVDKYQTVYDGLLNVWEIERRKDSSGLQRHGFGKFEMGNTESSSNLKQFNKYSRLQWHLL